MEVKNINLKGWLSMIKSKGDIMTKVIKILKVKKGEPTKIEVEGQTFIREPQSFGVKESRK